MWSDATLCSLLSSESLLFVTVKSTTVTAPVLFTSRRATERATRSNNEALVPNQEFRNLTFFESRISIESFIISMLRYCNDLPIILALLSKYLSSSPMICNRSRSIEARHYAGHSLTSEELQRTGNHSSDPRYRIIRRLDGFTDAASPGSIISSHFRKIQSPSFWGYKLQRYIRGCIYIQTSWSYNNRTSLFMIIKRNMPALRGSSANMQGEDEPQKTKADASRQHRGALARKTTLTLYNLHDRRAACDVLQVMNRSPTIAAYAVNAEVQSASTPQTRER
jgi:hypothetical protein